MSGGVQGARMTAYQFELIDTIARSLSWARLDEADLRKSIREAITASKISGWFEVAGPFLPPYGVPVLVVDTEGQQAICCRVSSDAKGENWELEAAAGDSDPEFTCVTHWQPKPPRPGEEEREFKMVRKPEEAK